MQYIKVILQIFFVLLMSFGSKISITKKKIAIIGCGAAGLITADCLLNENRINTNANFEITIFEKNNYIGGVWKYVESNKIKDNPMYLSLKTNLPKEIMSFNFENRFGSSSTSASFISHFEVLEYLNNFAETKHLMDYIEFNSTITEIFYDDNLKQWVLKLMKISSYDQANEITTTYDAVIVCNGHFNKPYIPSIPGDQYIKSKSMHAISYDNSEFFKNLSVLIVGTKSSGTDMAKEISQVAKVLYVCGRSLSPDMIKPDSNIIIKPALLRINEDGSIMFSDNSNVFVDVILWCTGYCYDYPFIKSSSKLNTIQVIRHKAVKPLYQYIFNVNNPTLSFVGLPYSVVPFPLFYIQANYISSILSGRCSLPSLEEQKEWLVQSEINADSIEQYHNLGGVKQFNYMRTLAKYSCIYTTKLEKYIDVVEQIYFDNSNHKPPYPGAPDSYRNRVYKVNWETFTWSVYDSK